MTDKVTYDALKKVYDEKLTHYINLKRKQVAVERLLLFRGFKKVRKSNESD